MDANFICNSVKKTGMVNFVLLILAFFIVNVGQINFAHAHHRSDIPAQKLSTVWLEAESVYPYFNTQHDINRDILHIVLKRPRPGSSFTTDRHSTTVRIRVFAAEGLTKDTRYSTKNDDGVIVGREFSVKIGAQELSRDTEETIEIPINQATIDEIFESIDPSHSGRKRTIGIEIVPPAPQNNYHLAGSAGAINSSDPKQRVTLDCRNQTDAGQSGAPGPRCTTIYFSILDDDVPLVEIKKINEQGVSEDGPAQFMITSDIIPVNPITVPFTIPNKSTNLNFIETLDSVTIDGSSDYCDAQMTPQCSVPVDIIIANGIKNGEGEAESANGSFTAQIAQIADDTNGYKVHGGETADDRNTIMVNVFDDVVDTEVTVSTDNPIVFETQITNDEGPSNNSIVAKFAVNGTPEDDLTIYYSVEQQGNSDFLSEDTSTTGSFTITAEQFNLPSFTGHEVPFELEDDEVDEQNGSIVVTVEAGLGYISTGAGKTQTFQILDDDEPEIRIHNPPTSRSETDTTTFEIVASIEPWQPIDVTFSTEGTMGECLTETRVQTLSGTRPVSVNIIDNDMIDETDCAVVITLTDDDTEKDSGYSISDMETLKKAQFTVTDDDVPLIEVASRDNSEFVGEATDWQFKLTSDIIPVEEITVAYNVNTTINNPSSQNSDDFFNVPTVARTTQFSSTLNCTGSPPCEVTFDIIAENGAENEFDGASFSVELTAVSTENIGKYRIHEGSNASKNTITIQVTDDNLPTVSIRSNKLEFKEGELDDNGVEIPIAIIFSITQAPTSDLTVMYIVNQNGLDFLDPTSIGTKEVTISVAEFSDLAHPLPITIINDSKNEKDSIINDFDETRSIDVTLVGTLGYNIMGTAADNTLKFTIRDDDIPVVNISAPMTERSEARSTDPDFNVQITNTDSITELWRPVEVSFTAMETSGVCLNETRTVRVNLTPAAGVMIVDDDEVDEIDCVIVITLTATDDSYIIDDAAMPTNITIKDDDLSLLSFKDSDRNAFSEESGTQFILQIPDPAPHNIPVYFEVEQTDGGLNFLNDVRMAEIPAGQTEVPVGVLVPDDVIEVSSLITVTLTDDNDTFGFQQYGDRYEIPEGQEAELMFTAYSDDGASVSISAENREFGEEILVIPVMFTANTTEQSISTVTINYSVTEGIENAGSSFLPQDLYTDIQEIPVDITNGSGTKEVIIRLDNDNFDEADGSIVVAIEVGAYMTLENNSIEFQVRDNDDPVVQIRKPTNIEGVELNSVSAGQAVRFTIDRLMTEGNQSLDVDIQISQVGDVILWRVPNRVSFQVGQKSTEIDILTRRGQVPENSSITVTLVANSALYTFGDELTTSRMIDVHGSDSDQNRISVASEAVSSILEFLAGNEESEEPTPALSAGNVEYANVGDLKPIISIHSSKLPVNEGETIIFQFNSSITISSNIPIKVRVVGNSKEPNQTAFVNIQPGQVQGSLLIPTTNDNDANEDRTVTATLQPSTIYELGSNHSATVTISDAEDRDRLQSILETSNQQVLPELFSTTGNQILNAIDGRVQQYFNNNEQNTLVLDGNTAFTNIVTSSGGGLANESISLRDIIGNSSFSLNLFGESDISNSSTFWGIGDIQDISGYQVTNQQTWKGDSFVGQFGLDTRIGEETLAGVTYSASDAEVNYINYQDDQISYKSSTIGFHPYFGWKSNDNGIELSVQTGYGFGEVEIDYEDIYKGTLDTKYYTVAIESTKNIFTNNNLLTGNTSELNLIFDSEFSQQNLDSRDRYIDDSQIEFRYLNIAAEGKQSTILTDNQTVDSSLTIGLIQQYAKNQSESGIGTSSNIEFTDSSGLKISGVGNVIMPFENQIQRVIEGALNFDTNQDQKGIQFEILGIYGNADSSDLEFSKNKSFNHLYSNDLKSNVTNQRLVSEIGYGFSTFDGLGSINPYTGMSLTENSTSDYRLGSVLKLGSNIEFELLGKNSYNSQGTNSQSIELDGKISW